MPVPWGPGTCARIPLVEHRAISIQQLRDLQVFLQRLCKLGLLKSRQGQRIQWFNINMYDICDLVVKPAIAFVEQHRGTNGRYSWVEFVATSEQPPQLLFSHSWTGRFRDFMSVVGLLARSRGLSASVAIWICTFANCQFGEDFGAGLRDSPFYKAIQAAPSGTLLVVDRDASSLQRIWCGLELHLTMLMQKPLQVYTSVGQVGVAVTSGWLVDEVEKWDVRRMEASQDSDRRQILNFLIGGEKNERAGLKTDADGNLEIVDGWRKQLDGDGTTADAPIRMNGRMEYAHEAGLFKAHDEKFDKLNRAVRDKVRKAANAGEDNTSELGCVIPRLEDRGITLGELRAFAKKLCLWSLSADSGAPPYEKMTVRDVARRYVVQPSVTHPEYSYAETVSKGPRRAQFVVDEVWDALFEDLVSTVDWFAEAQKLQDATVLYLTPLCMNMQDVKAASVGWDSSIKTLLLNSEGILCILEGTKELTVRSNRMQQLQICFEHAKNVYLGCSDGVLACTAPFPDSIWEFGLFRPELGRILLDADWSEATCKDKEVEARIRASVRASRGGLAGFAARLARVAAGPVLREAARVGDAEGLAELRRTCGRPGFLINSAALRGALGETAAHVAAAAGNVEALQLLLDCHADPNAEDHIRETPMHYAAMAGMVGAVKLLLTYGGQSGAESAFAETPLFVARQNPASFLGVSTDKAVALLEVWEGAEGSPRLCEEVPASSPLARQLGPCGLKLCC